mmetsp:Transcript_9325/g.16836  ORF Transcript_9325/g.16836 Transcript_9325/m.16836 type:complete len:568 (-) Transcript_9325:112-1815(-)
MPRKHYSTAAYNELTTAVEGFIHDKLTVKEVCEVLHRNRETAGTTAGVAPYFIEAVEGIIRSILHTRLKDAAADAILVGRRHLQKDHVDHLGNSITESQLIGHDAALDIPEFRSLWQNLQVRSRASSRTEGSFDNAVWMIHQLVSSAREKRGANSETGAPKSPRPVVVPAVEEDAPTPSGSNFWGSSLKRPASNQSGKKVVIAGAENTTEPPPLNLQSNLTMATQALICKALLPLLKGSKEVSDRAVRLGLIDALRMGLMRSKAAPNQEHPRFALAAASLLAEIALHSAQQVEQQESVARAVRPFLKHSLGMDFRHLSSWGQHALDSLKMALERTIECNEHATLWGIMVALQKCAENHFCCESLLLMGFLPVLRGAVEKYAQLPRGGSLPPPVDPDDDINPAPTSASIIKRQLSIPAASFAQDGWTKEAPAFPNRIASPALERCSTTVKAHWLSKTPSLPALKKSTFADLDAVANRRSSDLQILPKAALDEMPGAAAGGYGHKSLMKDSVEEYNDGEGHKQICDRNFILLRLRKLLGAMEKTRQQMKRPFAGFHSPKNVDKEAAAHR